MIYARLFFEFMKTGLFAVGGGMATIPFLKEMGERTGWFTSADLMNMLAIAESTPGPVGINMATYVGFTTAGITGGVVATLGEITPSIVVIIIIAGMLARFRDSKTVKNAFYGLRPASTGLISAAALSVIVSVLLTVGGKPGFNGAGWVFALILYIFTNKVKATKGLHPIVFIAVSALAGILCKW